MKDSLLLACVNARNCCKDRATDAGIAAKDRNVRACAEHANRGVAMCSHSQKSNCTRRSTSHVNVQTRGAHLATFIPESRSLPNISSESHFGPRVQMILHLRTACLYLSRSRIVSSPIFVDLYMIEAPPSKPCTNPYAFFPMPRTGPEAAR